MNPWTSELLLARDRLRESDRRALARDADRGLLIRLRNGVYVERVGYETMGEQERHVLRMRALVAVSDAPPVFSHGSAALIHRIPTTDSDPRTVHTVSTSASGRSVLGVRVHVAPLGPGDVVFVGGLRVTSVARTVIDIALASPFRSGVVAADGALHAAVPRVDLEQAVVGAAEHGRRGVRRAQDVVAFADGGAESANESQARVSHCQLGIAPPILQWEVHGPRGFRARTDFGYPWVRGAGEADGDTKYLDPRFAPAGAGRKVIDEKRREDELRSLVDGLARWGYRESCTPALLAPVLARIGVVPVGAGLADYSTAFRLERLVSA